MTVLLCPLCSQPRFNNLESLRISLINVATQNISCPICNEILAGLDKLTIHLFGHTLNQNPEKRQCLELNITEPDEGLPGDPSKSASFVTGESQTLHKKLVEENASLNIIDLPLECGRPKDVNSSTVNMEDLSFLTSWDSSIRVDDSKDPENINKKTPDEDNSKEDSTGLSEYMSDLLNKKLPVLNFVFTMDNPPDERERETEKPVRQSEQFKCPTCDFSFQNSIILSMHQELAHSKPKKAAESQGVTDTAIFGNFVLPRYSCHICSKSFKMKGSLLVHYRVAHLGAGNAESLLANQLGTEERNFHCSICLKSFKKEQHLTQHIKTHEGKQWHCETCNKHFTTKYFLKKHQRLHTGEMPYSCQTCHKTFTFQQSYHKHLLYHSDEKPHRCDQCGRSFKELSTLHNHQRIHSGEKPFACETCGKCFRQRVSYIVHQRIHTGVLPYQCTACKKKFRYKVSQRSHKCTAQPPGIVVRQPGDLIQRILEHRNDVLQCTQ